jgi:hypothetical protein
MADKKAKLAEEEFALWKGVEDKSAKYHLKMLKAREAADKKHLQVTNRILDIAYNDEKRRLAQMARDKKMDSFEFKRLELEAEKEMLQKKLDANKDYFQEWLKIQEKMNQNTEAFKVLEYDMEMSSKDFMINMAQEIANATFSIMSNNLSREMNLRKEALNKEYELEIGALDMQLRDKAISQADYDGKKMMADIDNDKKMLELEKENARREKRIAIAQAVINGALAITKVYAQHGTLATFVVPLIIGATMAQLAVIESQTFAKGGILEEYAKGGMVNGKSHAQGGERFAVGGRVVELEGGEAVINKRSTAMFKPQLSAMNAVGGGVRFADGGLLNSSSFSSARFNSAGFNKSSGGSSRVVVVESDITNSQNKVRAIQSNASF